MNWKKEKNDSSKKIERIVCNEAWSEVRFFCNGLWYSLDATLVTEENDGFCSSSEPSNWQEWKSVDSIDQAASMFDEWNDHENLSGMDVLEHHLGL